MSHVGPATQPDTAVHSKSKPTDDHAFSFLIIFQSLPLPVLSLLLSSSILIITSNFNYRFFLKIDNLTSTAF